MNRRSALKFLAAASASPFIFRDDFEEPMKIFTIPPSVGGINARDALVSMPKTDAVSLLDFVPEQTYLESAPPCLTYTDSTRIISTIIPYRYDTTETLLGVYYDSGSGQWDIKDITDTGAISTLKEGWGMVNSGTAYWTIFNGKLIMCGGADEVQVYNGTTITSAVFVAGEEPIFRGCVTFKGRVYYWNANSASFWYAAAGSYQGAITEFDVGTVTSKGGSIVQLISMTRDGGEGANDLFVILMNTGETLVYNGDDPGDANAWSLVGRFFMPRPIGGRSARNVGGNLFVVTTDGIVDYARVLAGDPYPLVSAKVGTLPAYKQFPDEIPADQIELAEFSETNSLLVMDSEVSNLQDWGVSETGTLAVKKTTGAWWQYKGGLIMQFNDGYFTGGCVFQGRTYLVRNEGAGSTIYVIAQGSGTSEVKSSVWTPTNASGSDFAVNVSTTAGYFDPQPLLTGYDIADAQNASAFVSPFGGTFGQVTMIRYTYGVIDDFWPDAVNSVKVRWYQTELMLKAGGKM